MKTLLNLFLFSLLSVVSYAQQDIIDQFPKLPAKVNNKDLLEKGKNYNAKLGDKISRMLGSNPLINDYFPIGKIETRKAYILILGDVNQNGSNLSVSVMKISLTKKRFEPIVGSSKRYLTMAGEDALKRVGNINYTNGVITFKLESFDPLTGKASKSESGNTTLKYKVGKKDLERI